MSDKGGEISMMWLGKKTGGECKPCFRKKHLYEGLGLRVSGESLDKEAKNDRSTHGLIQSVKDLGNLRKVTDDINRSAQARGDRWLTKKVNQSIRQYEC